MRRVKYALESHEEELPLAGLLELEIVCDGKSSLWENIFVTSEVGSG